MFRKNVHLNSKTEMVSFLKDHFRYYTMNSWNMTTSYANNVKLYNLGIPDHLDDKAYDFLNAECDMFEVDLQVLIDRFMQSTGYSAGFNGRNNGYIVLYETETNRLNTVKYCAIGRSIDQDADFEDWSMDDLRERVKLVQAFDELCDKIRDTFLYYVEHSTIKTVEETKTITKNVAVLSN